MARVRGVSSHNRLWTATASGPLLNCHPCSMDVDGDPGKLKGVPRSSSLGRPFFLLTGGQKWFRRISSSSSAGYGLTTAEILYRLPDHPVFLQSYIWQDYDVAPRFPVLRGFLVFWAAKLDGHLHSVRVAHSQADKTLRASPRGQGICRSTSPRPPARPPVSATGRRSCMRETQYYVLRFVQTSDGRLVAAEREEKLSGMAAVS